MFNRRIALSLPLFALAASSFGKKKSAVKAFEREMVSFKTPRGWSQEDSEDGRALYFMSPEIDGGHEASMLIELPQPTGDLSLELQLKARSNSNSGNFENYAERRLVRAENSRGLTYFMLEYEATKKRLFVVERVMYVPVSKGRCLLVFGSTSERTAKDNLRVFEQFMQSLAVPQ